MNQRFEHVDVRRPMSGRRVVRAIAAAVLGLGLGLPSALAAQDGFGAAVWASSDDQVLVLKPVFGRGPAAVLVFERDGDTWVESQKLWSEGSLLGESFGRTMAPVSGGFLVASGDPSVAVGAYGFSQGAGGEWVAGTQVPLAEAVEGEAPASITMQDVMAILQPPARAVGADGDIALVAAPSGMGSRRSVKVFERDGSGTWRETGLLEADDVRATARFGTALAVHGDLAAVGAPRQGGSGAVYLFQRDASGSWSAAGVLESADLPQGGGLGTTLAFLSGDQLAVGAPAANGSSGRVVFFGRTPSGSWAEAGSLVPLADEPGQQFGASIAATDLELLIGAPGAAEGRGRVDAFERGSLESEWHATGSIVPSDLPAGSAFGSAVALRSGLAVIGGPGAYGNAGIAGIYEVGSDGDWSEVTWVQGAAPPQAVTSAEVRCEDDVAAGFDCADVDLQAYLPLASIGAGPDERVSDAWGWTDPETGREYGLIGRTRGAAIVDVTDAVNPVYLGYIPANPSGARDLKVYDDHLFFTGDGAGAHGLVVFDLTRLRDVTNAPVTFDPDTRYDGIGSAHNLIIDTDAGTAFTVSTSGDGHTCGGGLVMIDIREPLEPEFAGCFTDTEGLIFQGRTHDAQCLIYDGPDQDYQGRELCFASNETALRVVDVTDKSNPIPISAAAYPGVAYIHQGWLSDDRRYFYLNDELDELVGTTERTKTIVWDVTDLDDPVVVSEYYGPNGSTDHNLYVKGDRMYQANYQAGFRVIDISDPENPTEVGYFDTTPYGADPPGFNGAWTAFPYFVSETVLVTSMLEGVFLLKPRRDELVP